MERAAAALVPVRVGAAVTQFDKTHRHSFGPATADDGTPAGYPNSDADHDHDRGPLRRHLAAEGGRGRSPTS